MKKEYFHNDFFLLYLPKCLKMYRFKAMKKLKSKIMYNRLVFFVLFSHPLNYTFKIS